MGRRKDTYTAKLNSQRRTTIDGQGKVRIPLEIQHGDPGRRVDLLLTDEEIDSLSKGVREARVLFATERERAEQRQRAWELQAQVWNLERHNKDLERQKEELKGMLDRVHDVVHPDRSLVVDFPERPVVVAPSSNVAH